MPLNKDIKKVLVIGSGPIVIGQAAEFDYAGTQACRVLKEAGVNVVLVNSNPATIMTDSAMADEIYLEPLTARTVKRIIEKEHPDSILAGLGGQTGLTIAMQLDQEGYLARHNVTLLGTNAEAIAKAEDRQLFRDTMVKIGQPVIPSDIATDVERACEIATEIGYPIIIRPAFTLGGAGGGVAHNEAELRIIATNGLLLSPITQVLVEKYIYGWKEIEFEVMRDRAGNAIAVCSMENVDPVGVHTGDSIVVAPALTLSNVEYQMLRRASLDIITELGIEGGCNCQFALDPVSFDYAVIEVNPRVSRSSALASKATGYPIAKVTAKIALGYTLDEIKNDVTGQTCAAFEPAVDYVVVKLPKWPFDKFTGASRQLGTQMKATGEVMSIGPSFEMALMKAIRGAEISLDELDHPALHGCDNIRERLAACDDLRIFAVYEALRQGLTPQDIYDITRIDPWFSAKLKNLVDFAADIRDRQLDADDYLLGKRLGYPDAALRRISGHELPEHRAAVYKMVDTCAAEFAAETPYFYSTYDDECEAAAHVHGDKKRIIVLGSGPIRIGQGIEFDYSSVHCVRTLKNLGYEVIIINNNPETVSTDFDTADRLYFEPLTKEDVLNVVRLEQPEGVVVAFGGQTAIKLTNFLDAQGVRILGTSAEAIDQAEDRSRFDALLERLNIKRPRGLSVMTEAEALAAAAELGYPVLLRPSYVIGGQNMTIAYQDEDVQRYMGMILAQGIENPVLVDQYLQGVELEVDVISDGRDVLIPGIMEHIERAGVHSGDSIAVYPPFNLSDAMRERVVYSSTQLALAMGTRGLVNIQYLIYHGELYVIEVNPRASRTIPYISKVTGVPMVELASRIMVGASLYELGYGVGLYPAPPYVAVKVPVFSFAKLSDVNSALGPEMKSTGEVLGVGRTLAEALFKGLTSAGFSHWDPNSGGGGVFLTVSDQDKVDIVSLAKKLDELGLRLYATKNTGKEIAALGVDVSVVPNLSKSDDIMQLLEAGNIQYIVYTGIGQKKSVEDYIRLCRRAIQLAVPCLTSLDTANALADMLRSRFNEGNTELVDINHLRRYRLKLNFSKIESSGGDYVYFDNLHGDITCPEVLSVNFCDRHFGVGGYGVVMIEKSEVADCRMRVFNNDGSESSMAASCILGVAKYVYDNGVVSKQTISVETASGVKKARIYLQNGQVSSVSLSMGPAGFAPEQIPVLLPGQRLVDYPFPVAGRDYRVTFVSLGNPHCVIFRDHVDTAELEQVGPIIEHMDIFPERMNTEFVRVVNDNTLKLRVWERGNGETLACGSGACAAVSAAVANGLISPGHDVTVKARGGDFTVRYSDDDVIFTGSPRLVYSGVIEY